MNHHTSIVRLSTGDEGQAKIRLTRSVRTTGEKRLIASTVLTELAMGLTPPRLCRGHLVEELSRPREEGVELVRINYKINDEPNWSQHEYEVSHGIYPALTWR
jgi:hypothetical protein